MLPRFKPTIGWQEFAAAIRLPRKNDVEIFETAFAKKMGHKHAIAFPYGRTGLIILLEALGIKGKEIICPAYTCIVVANAIVHSGNTPVFIDCEENGFNMDLELALEAINENTGAIIATSLFGHPVDLDKLDSIRQRHKNLKIIQDCAHSFTAEWRGRPVQNDGVAALYGLSISKLITSVLGGMVATDDDLLAERIRSLRKKQLRPATIFKSVKRFFYLLSIYVLFFKPIYRIIFRMGNLEIIQRFFMDSESSAIVMPGDLMESMCGLEARVGLIQLKKFDGILRNRKSLAQLYHEDLSGTPFIRLPHKMDGATYSHYVVRVSSPDPLIAHAEKQGVELGRFIEYTIDELESYQPYKYFGNKVSQTYSVSVINLPIGQYVDEISARTVCRLIMEVYGNIDENDD